MLMTDTFRLPRHFQGYLLLFLSLLPMMVALHQLMVLAFNLAEGTATLQPNLLLTGESLVAAGVTALALRKAIHLIDK
jgi:hypothetical protein